MRQLKLVGSATLLAAPAVASIPTAAPLRAAAAPRAARRRRFRDAGSHTLRHPPQSVRLALKGRPSYCVLLQSAKRVAARAMMRTVIIRTALHKGVVLIA